MPPTRTLVEIYRLMSLIKQNDEQNRIYYEPRCIEGNIGYPTVMRNARLEDDDFAKGKGPDPLTHDNASGFGEDDPLQQ